MIERKFVSQNIKEFAIKEYIASQLNKVGLSDVKLQRTPLGEKIIVVASRPGLVVGRGGSNIQKITRALKEKFKLENPQLEIEEVTNTALDPMIIAEGIAGTLERFGTKRFKSAGHRALQQVMDAGAFGVEILISGKIPSQRARTWRFYEGYLKKCGDIAVSGVDVAYTTAHLKVGSVGIKVSIMPSTTVLPDNIIITEEPQRVVEEVTSEEEKDDEKSKKTGTKGKEKKSSKKTTKKSIKRTIKRLPKKSEEESEETPKEDVKEESEGETKKAEKAEPEAERSGESEEPKETKTEEKSDQ